MNTSGRTPSPFCKIGGYVSVAGCISVPRRVSLKGLGGLRDDTHKKTHLRFDDLESSLRHGPVQRIH